MLRKFRRLLPELFRWSLFAAILLVAASIGHKVVYGKIFWGGLIPWAGAMYLARVLLQIADKVVDFDFSEISSIRRVDHDDTN